jgi:lambda family phage minor tail protein L
MPTTGLPLEILAEKNQLATLERFIWLYEIHVPTDPLTLYRLVRAPESVDYQGRTYSPFPITHDVIPRDNEGDLPETTLTVSNVSREIISTLETYNGLVGQQVKVILAHSLSLGNDAVPVGEEVFYVVRSAADAKAATLVLGTTNLHDLKVPKTRMMRTHCRHQYRSAQCGYSLDESNANYLSGCDKTLDGKNGCRVHGESYTAAGLTAIHPKRFGGFPGIPARRNNNTRI